MFFSAIVFDFDGVIVESTDIKSQAFYDVALPWGKEAAERMAKYHAEHFGVSRYVKFAWFFEHVLGRPITAKESTDLGNNFSEICLEKIKQAPYVPGFTDVLSVAYGRCPLYIASATPQEELERILAWRDIGDFFKAVYGSPPGKTKLLEQAVEAMNLPAANILMVGDSNTDLEAALAVGTKFYGRGEQFKKSGFPWGQSLMELVVYLKSKLD